VHETPDDLVWLEALVERSHTAAGAHLRSITTDERRVAVFDLVERLRGLSLLTVATVTADGRPLVGAVDGIFYRAHFYFSTGGGSVRFRHLSARPFVSANHLPSARFAVTVHGRAEPVDLFAPEQEPFRETLREVYIPRQGPGWWEEFLRLDPHYFRIDPRVMFTFSWNDPPVP
jgi:hypothetical protein